MHAVVPAHELDVKVAEYVREILTNAPAAVGAAKALIRDVGKGSPADVSAANASVLAKLRVAPDGQEGLKAFLEKRKPWWSS